MKMDRDLQRNILEDLAEAYPYDIGLILLKHQLAERDLLEKSFEVDDIYWANLKYLNEHGLVRISGAEDEGDDDHVFITHKGLDFLADDGGLSAILGVVTIRLHDDQVRLMLASRIQESDAPEAEKRKWLDQLRGIPADATKHLVHKLIDAGLAQWPVVLAAMQTLAK